MLRRWIARYFGFSRKETNGFITLIPILVMVLLVPSWVKKYLPEKQNHSLDQVMEDSLVNEIRRMVTPRESQKQAKHSKKEPILKPSSFDPNRITHSELLAMGISNRIASTLVNYRSKGGVFKVKTDLSKIYGVDEKLFEELSPYIALPDSISPIKSDLSEKYDDPIFIVPGNLNDATAEELKKIRGIGDVLSKRIIAYRTSLGGFYSTDQLFEVYGLQDSIARKVTQAFKVGIPPKLEKIDVANASQETLKKHPYINYRLSNLIVAYRGQHTINEVDDLRGIKVLSDSLFEKLKPYFVIKPPRK